MRDHEIVIVGAGPAGVAAAVQCARLGMRPLLLDRSGSAGGLTACAFSIENYPGLGPTDGESFAALLAAHLARFDVAVTRGEAERVEIDGERFEVHGDFGEVRARSVILGTGTDPRRLAIPGADLVDYTPLAAIRGAADKVLVIGGGEAALDYSLTLARSGARVRVLVRGSGLRARGRLVDLVQKNPAIELVFGAEPLEIRRVNERFEVEVAGTGARSREVGDRVVAAIGRVPTAGALFKALDAAPFEAVSTRRRGLFVAGDARVGSLGQAGMAVGDGLAAAMAAVALLATRE